MRDLPKRDSYNKFLIWLNQQPGGKVYGPDLANFFKAHPNAKVNFGKLKEVVKESSCLVYRDEMDEFGNCVSFVKLSMPPQHNDTSGGRSSSSGGGGGGGGGGYELRSKTESSGGGSSVGDVVKPRSLGKSSGAATTMDRMTTRSLGKSSGAATTMDRMTTTSINVADGGLDAYDYFQQIDGVDFEPMDGSAAAEEDDDAVAGFGQASITSELAHYLLDPEGSCTARDRAARAPLLDWEHATARSRNNGPGNFGLLGFRTVNEGSAEEAKVAVALNVSEPFCLVAVGVQGSGKSHTIGTVIENCAVPSPGSVQLQSPMPVLVLHYDDCVANPCECASVVMPGIRAANHLKSGGFLSKRDFDVEVSRDSAELPKMPAAARVVVLASPSYYKQRANTYARMPRTTVRPLLFSWKTLTASQLKILMSIQPGDSQLYVATLLNILRRFQMEEKKPKFDSFKKQLLQSMPSSSQSDPLLQRLDLLETFLAESEMHKGKTPVSIGDIIKEEPGTVIIADLTDPMLDASAANGVFQVLLEEFRDLPSKHGKLCVLDEAHKYMSGDKAKSGMLAASVVETVRQMRHYGQRIAISTQSPTTLPPEVLELSSVVLCHQFHSKDWYDFLRKKIPLPDDGFEVSQRLEPGEAIAFSKGLANVTSNNEDEEPKAYMKLQMRMRLTADGGASRRPTQRRRNAE